MKFKFNSDRLKKDFPYLLIIFAIVLAVNRNLLLNFSDPPTGTDTLGWIAATSYMSEGYNFLYVWLNYSFGVSGALSQLYGVLATVNIFFQNAMLTVKIYLIVIFMIAGISMYATTYFFTNNRISGLISALFFILNPLFIGLVGSGQFNTVFVYSFGPILFLSFYRIIERKNQKYLLIFSFSMMLMLAARLDQFLYYGLFIGLYCIFTFFDKDIKKNALLKVIFKSILLAMLFGMIFFLPVIMGANPPYFGVRTLTLQRLEWYSSTIYEVLLGIPTKSYIPIISQIHPLTDPPHYAIKYLFIPTIFAFSAILLKRNKLILVLMVSAILSLSLATGSRPPLGNIYSWMWLNLPYFEIFSIPSRWLIITHFSYSILIGITINEMSKKFQTGKITRTIPTILITVLIISIFLGNWFALGKGLQTWKFPDNELEAYNFISNKSGDFRILPVPYARESMETKWGLLRDLGFESSLFHGKEVVRTGEGVRYSKEFIAYSDYLMLTNKTNNIGKILGEFNVKYFVLSDRLTTWNTPSRVDPKYQSSFLKNQNGLITIYDSNNILIYENEYWNPKISTSLKSAIVVGGRETLTSLAELNDFNFSKWGIFYADQIIRENGIETYIDQLNKSDTLIFVNSEPLDLAMLMLDDAKRIKAAQYDYPSIDPKEHWIASDTATKMGMFVLNSVTLSTSGENDVSIQIKSEKDGSYEVWTRLVYDKNVGKLGVNIDGKDIESIVPYSKFRDIKWVKLGDVKLSKGNHDLLLQNKKSGYGVTNEIDEIILVEPEKLANKIDEVNKELEKSNRIIVVSDKQRVGKTMDFLERSNFPKLNYQRSEFKDYLVYYTRKEGENEVKFPDIFKTEDSSPEINYTKINPTKYKVKVKTDKPFFLIFSDSYHPLWRAYIDGEEIESIISYSFINGFYIPKTGEYEVTIEFIGQRYVWIGGLISLTTFIFAISYILFENRMLQIVRESRKRFYGGNN